jgi:hypothetical protein
VTANYTAQQLVSSRGEVSILLDENLNSKLNEYGVVVDDLNIINWDFTEEYISAIEAKQVAEQNLIRPARAGAGARHRQHRSTEAGYCSAGGGRQDSSARGRNCGKQQNHCGIAQRILIRYELLQKWDGQLPKSPEAQAPSPTSAGCFSNQTTQAKQKRRGFPSLCLFSVLELECLLCEERRDRFFLRPAAVDQPRAERAATVVAAVSMSSTRWQGRHPSRPYNMLQIRQRRF